MKLKFISAMLLSLVAALPANAQQLPPGIPNASGEWVYGWYSPYNPGDKFPPSQTDIDSFYKIEGNTRRVWTRRTYDWIDRSNIAAVFNYSTIFCAQRKYRLDYTANYNSNGVLVSSNAKKSPVYSVKPGSNAEILIGAVCR